MTEQQSDTTTRPSGIERFIGGSPAGVALRLLVVSLIVGFLMSIFGVSPMFLIDSAIDLFHAALRDGFGAFRTVGAYVLAGAAIVVPIWFVIRLTKAR